MHLSIGDLAQAQKAGTKMLTASLADTDMAAIVSMSGKINSGLTTDRAQLQDAIMKLQPQNLYRMTGSECPPMDYYHADLIENKHNSNALEAAIEEVMSCSPGTACETPRNAWPKPPRSKPLGTASRMFRSRSVRSRNTCAKWPLSPARL